MTESEELRQLATQTRNFIRSSHDQAWALQAVVQAHDVVLGIFPDTEGLGLHVIKGDAILREIASQDINADYSHTAIAVQNREQAVALQRLLQ